MAAALLGMLTKEDVVVVPLLAVGLDWLVVGTRLRTTLWRALRIRVDPTAPALLVATKPLPTPNSSPLAAGSKP